MTGILFRLLRVLSILPLGISCLPAQSGDIRSLEYTFDGHYGQIEVGGPFAGAEFHSSKPLPSRISFYYPVANSIDLSTDYWKRGESMPCALGLQVDGGKRRWLGRDPWSYSVSPHTVEFHQGERDLEFVLRYDFCLHEPAMVRTLLVRNISPRPHAVVLYSHLKPALRTCQTYARIDSARTRFDEDLSMTVFDFDEPTTDSATVFIEDAGIKPSRNAFDVHEIAATDSGTSGWISDTGPMTGNSWSNVRRHPAVAASEYREVLNARDSLRVVQIIGSSRREETQKIAARLALSWKTEIEAYRKYVEQESMTDSELKTGDPSFDASARWAKGILAANAHYIDSAIVPMPCPAEYNFFFSHDVLMTDLSAVNFDLPRVRKDLLYIAAHAKDHVIPHAYYWRDDGFKTEYCTPDNWNHFWFILTTGAYLRHSFDTMTVRTLFPLVTKSLEEVLTQVKPDYLMHAFRPDWWDIGHLEGPRAYTTILTIRSLREFLFISSFLHRESIDLPRYEALADSMQNSLSEKLWDEKLNYLVNFNQGREDTHFYMGSLLAVVFGLLDHDRSLKLIRTATRELLDTNLGVRTAMPPDFHTPASIGYYKFAGEEAGKPYTYINGGVWPHDNAWYAIALNTVGQADPAFEFVRRTMTLDGTTHSPNGQPAMYEYRFADPSSSRYGMIDKPSFLWAGGFYLKTLYHLFGLRENEWNLSFDGVSSEKPASVSYTLEFGEKKMVDFSSRGRYLATLTCGSISVPSAVLPVDAATGNRTIRAVFGSLLHPYLKSVNAIVYKIQYDSGGVLGCDIASFPGHRVTAVIVAPSPPVLATVDGVPVSGAKTLRTPDGQPAYEFSFIAAAGRQHIDIHF